MPSPPSRHALRTPPAPCPARRTGARREGRGLGGPARRARTDCIDPHIGEVRLGWLLADRAHDPVLALPRIVQAVHCARRAAAAHTRQPARAAPERTQAGGCHALTRHRVSILREELMGAAPPDEELVDLVVPEQRDDRAVLEVKVPYLLQRRAVPELEVRRTRGRPVLVLAHRRACAARPAPRSAPRTPAGIPHSNDAPVGTKRRSAPPPPPPPPYCCPYPCPYCILPPSLLRPMSVSLSALRESARRRGRGGGGTDR